MLFINSPGDVLASTKLGPTPNSTSAEKHCPGCFYSKKSKDAKKPFSFLKGLRSSSIQKTCKCAGFAPALLPALLPAAFPAAFPFARPAAHHAAHHALLHTTLHATFPAPRRTGGRSAPSR